MRIPIIFTIFAILISACTSSQNLIGPVAQLTPYKTMSAITEEPILPTQPENMLVAPTATPTPNIHVVTLGETVSSIAFKYGVTIDAILQANPDITPNALIVGDEVAIPLSDDAETTYLDPVFLSNLKFSELNCIPSSGGLWCGLMLENKHNRDLDYPVVAFSFITADGDVLFEKKVPAVLSHLPAGKGVPIVLFIEDMPGGYSTIQTTLYSAKEILEEREIGDVIVEYAVDSIYGLSASITGSMRIEMENSDRADITVAVAAFGVGGKLVGVRRMDSTVAVNESFDYSITVYSAGGEIMDVILFVEVN